MIICQKKTFLTIDELISNIKSKNITIKNENNVRNILETNNYYFIMGYKFAFKNNDGTYNNDTSFEDIYSLYLFDKMLKLIILEPILEIEQKLKTIYNNNYSYRYGFKINDILDKNNYDLSNNYLKDTLLNLDKQLNDFGNKNKAVMFYRNNHTFTPLWVYMKILSFGMIRDMFYVSKINDKDFMKNKLTNEKVNSSEVANMLRLLVRVRNICCHDDILLSFNEGDIIYYNPVSNEMDCSNYTESNSQSENKTGCMKWYVIDGNGSDINLILDHNTTNKVAWNTSGSNTGGPVTVNAKLKSDVSSWSNEAKNSARLITFEELKGMVSNYSSLSEQEFIDSYFIKAIESMNSANENVKVSDYNTTKAHYQAQNDYMKKNYNDLILPDYMYEDILPKCADDGNCPTYGYWTSSPSAVNQNNNQAWSVVYFGMVFSEEGGVSRSDLLGVRPVITLAK